jgi:hypothetical protein
MATESKIKTKTSKTTAATGRKYHTLKDYLADVPRVAFTVPEFCAAYRLSLSMYYKLKKAGKGPRETHVMSKVTISHAAAEEWQRSCEKR